MRLDLQFFGGRGASSGRSDKGNKYGSQYHTVLEHENIKFVTNNIKNQEALMETMTDGRIYVQVGGDDMLRIVQFDKDNKRNKTIEKNKRTGEWHVHRGYNHTEYSNDEHEALTDKDKTLIDKITKLWNNRRRT